MNTTQIYLPGEVVGIFLPDKVVKTMRAHLLLELHGTGAFLVRIAGLDKAMSIALDAARKASKKMVASHGSEKERLNAGTQACLYFVERATWNLSKQLSSMTEEVQKLDERIELISKSGEEL